MDKYIREASSDDLSGDIPFDKFEKMISSVIISVLPKMSYRIQSRKGFGQTYSIFVGPVLKKGEEGAYNQSISFSYSDGILKVQIFGGYGGGWLSLNPSEEKKQLYSQSSKIRLPEYKVGKVSKSIDDRINKLEKRFTTYMERYKTELTKHLTNLKWSDKVDYAKYI
jgi:hypothetical protein